MHNRLFRCQLPLMMACGLLPIPVLLYCFWGSGSLMPWLVVPAAYLVLACACMLLPGRRRLLYAISGIAVLFAGGFWALGNETLVLRMAVALLYTLLLLITLPMAGWERGREPPMAIPAACICAHLLAQLFLFFKPPANAAVSALLIVSFILFLLLFMLSLNRQNLASAMPDSHTVPLSIRRRSRLLTWIMLGFVLLISLIVLGLSCLFGWVVARLSQRLKNRSYLTVLISLVLLGGYFVVYFNVMEQIRDVVGTALVLGNKIQYSAYPVYLFGRIGVGDGVAILVWAVGVLLVLGLIWILLNKTFLAISTATPAAKRTAYRERSVRQSSVAGALRRREWYRFSSSANYMLNSSMGILFLVVFGVYLLIDAKTLLDAANQILSVHSETIPVLLCSLICAMAGTIDISAPSVSLEGKTIWLVQSLPATPWQILCAKLELHLLVAVLPTLFCIVCAVVIVPATLAQKLLMVAVTMLFSLFIDVFGLSMGIKMPNLSWGNEISPLKQSAAVNITVLGGMGLGVALFGLYYIIGPDKLDATAYLSAATLILLGVDAYLFLWLRRQGVRRFAALN